MQPLILIVEDDPALLELLKYNVEKNDFRIVTTMDGEESLLLIKEEQPDLVVLDWMLPGVSGIEVCRRLRTKPETRNLPIIMLTAKGEERDRVHGLECGADDYMVKPFSPAELIARIKAVLRRSSEGEVEDQLTYEDIKMNLASYKVSRNEQSIHLGPKEYKLLEVFLKRPGRVYSREQLLDMVWGRDINVELRTVDVHIGRLRKALNQKKQPDLIRTVRAAGYALDQEKI
ncbi:MAG: phosphate regulon transcriptional regulator PhoB [Alphaproteobacteria bacterium]|nr:phosphate regulon transcriptional regulator PhoB [Rhodospirillales bacterium]MCW9045076.1 phosphate regulon transcriptional regulator PhoB [Alphaproteobacteria bacterium]